MCVCISLHTDMQVCMCACVCMCLLCTHYNRASAYSRIPIGIYYFPIFSIAPDSFTNHCFDYFLVYFVKNPKFFWRFCYLRQSCDLHAIPPNQTTHVCTHVSNPVSLEKPSSHRDFPIFQYIIVSLSISLPG